MKQETAENYEWKEQISVSNYKEDNCNSKTKELHILLKQNSYNELVKSYNKIPYKERTGEQTHCALSAFIALKQMNDARQLLEKYRETGKNDVQWNFQYGLTYYLEHKYKDAIPYFDKVEYFDSDETTILHYLEECNKFVGNLEEISRIENRIKEIKTYYGTSDKYTKENYYKK